MNRAGPGGRVAGLLYPGAPDHGTVLPAILFVLGPFPPGRVPVYNNRPPGSRPEHPLSLYGDIPENEQKRPLNRLPWQNVPTYHPVSTVRSTGHSVRSMACPVRFTIATIYRTATDLLGCPKPAKIGKTNLPES